MKRIKVGKWSFEPSNAGFSYHLYKDVEVSIKEDGKETGEKKTEDKLQGYDMPLSSIIKVISEDNAWKDSKTILELVHRIEIEIQLVTKVILDQLK